MWPTRQVARLWETVVLLFADLRDDVGLATDTVSGPVRIVAGNPRPRHTLFGERTIF